ncbi:response regulator [Tundrisphaera lichenicola]|uniref:response regulator n=1 Tax=Tundrisphaera lichenicola TaxID=2029860 RepID=UPI003EB9D4A0
MTKPRILNVGQCGYDHGSISRHLSKSYGAEVASADSKGQAMASLRAGEFDLVLVNRVLDFDGSSGLDLIRAIKADPDLAGVPVMLVSNYPEAQAEAQSLGALPGFGKSDLRSGAVPALDEVIGQSA